MSVDLYDQLMDLPDAREVVERARQKLAAQEEARQAFRKWLTPSIKAEFINGERILHSPVKKAHLVASGNLFMLLKAYVGKHNLGFVSAEKALVALGRNDFEPDICFWTSPRAVDWDDETMVYLAPDFVVEILSTSTAANDRGIKFRAYETYRIPEYWIVDPLKHTVEQYVIRRNADDSYRYTTPGTFGGSTEIASEAIEGLAFPAAAIFDDERCRRQTLNILG